MSLKDVVIPECDIDYPTRTWEKISVKQVVNVLEPIPLDTPKKEGHLRFVCISDTHSKTKNLILPKGDVLIHAGDFSIKGRVKEIEGFADFLAAQDFQYKVVIAGNHDLSFDKESYPELMERFRLQSVNVDQVKDLIRKQPGVTYLEDSVTNIQGIKIWGTPWQPEFGGWGFNLQRGEPCIEAWNKIPDDIDILISHGPPLGHGDITFSRIRAGCFDLLKTIQTRVKPKYHIFGHIHEGYGITSDGVTTYINASTCTLGYKPTNPPIIFDIPINVSKL